MGTLHEHVARTFITVFLRASLPVLLTHYCAGDKIEKNEMGWACSSDEEGERRVEGIGGETWGKETNWETTA
jgi:hypothetical protein